jgi:hypothetical protein
MAQVFGRKNKYLSRMDYISRLAAVLLFFVLIYIIYKYIRINSFGNSSSLIFILFVSIIYILGISYVYKKGDQYISRALSFKRGRYAEYDVCNYLENVLPENFFILRNLKLQKFQGDIDLLIIGPTGIFLLEVKSHSGKIDFDGIELTRNGTNFKEKNFLSQILKQVYNLRDYLKEKTGKEYFITPVIVFSNKYASMHFGLKPVYKNVCVVQKRFLKDLILKNNSQLSQSDVDMIKNELMKVVKL